MISALLFAQAVMAALTMPASEPPAPTDLTRLSIVVADTVSETDPQPLCPQHNCLSLFLGSYANAVVLAGPPVASQFKARVEMGSPFNMSYRLALIVEHREGREALVRSMAGFNDRTHEACFESPDTDKWGWNVSGPKIITRGRIICVAE